MPSTTREGRHARVHRLWDELADFPAAQTDAALLHLMKTLCGWLKADNAVWVGGVRMAHGSAARRDPQHGWRGRAVRHLFSTPEIEVKSAQAVRGQDTDPGMTTRAIAAGAGAFRVHRLRDGFVDFAAFQRTAHYRAFYADAGISDRLWAVFPVNEDAESCLLFDLYRTQRRFSAADAALAARALRGLKWFHRNLMLGCGLLVADTALTPTQQRVLALLLAGHSEKEAAAHLGQSLHTTHTHIKEIFRKFGVTSRAGFAAIWLGRAG